MKYLCTIYHFLGGVQFAIFLIASVTVFVIAGTFIESATQSHRYASLFTYGNPLFAALLWGFFINILVSALRRWPFQVRHIPFLITHIGLLMILGGALAKLYFGIQGNMNIVEGSGTHKINLNDTYAIYVEKAEQGSANSYPLVQSVYGGFQSKIPTPHSQLRMNLIDYTPHSTEIVESWIKGNYVTIMGLNPIEIVTIDEDNLNSIPVCGRVCFQPESSTSWNIFALDTDNVNETIAHIYLQQANLQITDRKSKEIITKISLKEALGSNFQLGGYGLASVSQTLDYSMTTGFNNPHIKLSIPCKNMQITIPLAGGLALRNINESTPFLGDLPFIVDITIPPLLAFIRDHYHDIHLISCDATGYLSCESFPNGIPSSIVAYDGGFKGYTVRTEIPLIDQPDDRTVREAALIQSINEQLRQVAHDNIDLSPPLQLLQAACEEAHVDFADCFTQFLTHWNANRGWLCNSLPTELENLFTHLNWDTIPQHEFLSCSWIVQLFEHLEPSLTEGKSLYAVLKEQKWPILNSFQTNSEEQTYAALTKQIFSAAQSSPNGHFTTPSLPIEHALLLSAYLRGYDIHLQTILPVPNEPEMRSILSSYRASKNKTQIHSSSLEAILSTVHHKELPKKKIEDNTPKITLHVRKGASAQTVSLSYDPHRQGLKWPILNGEYLIRFQSDSREIPYHVRLRNARQINYANSAQPYSFESDLIIVDRRNGSQNETTISMNQVHETWDGYRFYLSSIAPPDETSIKQVQIVVNHDPAKYWLTYPGAFILTLGMLLLFFL